jgi:RNA polymerase sigma-70 factor (ECF subfamily)
MERPDSADIAKILERLGAGDPEAAERLMPLVYDELRSRARRYLRRERKQHSLQPTALVHEVYLRLVGEARIDWRGRTHFLATSALAMRRILVDHARRRNREKRGGEAERVAFDEADASVDPVDVDVLALHRALEKLATLNERHARIVELRFFGGLTVEEVAEVMGLSRATIEAGWTFAKTWLKRELSEGGEEPAG